MYNTADVLNDDVACGEPFDYTIWQRDLYKDMSVKELYDKIKDSEKTTQ
jgi:hypothetical protein